MLGRREISLQSAGAKTNELIAKQVHKRGFVLDYNAIEHDLKSAWLWVNNSRAFSVLKR